MLEQDRFEKYLVDAMRRLRQVERRKAAVTAQWNEALRRERGLTAQSWIGLVLLVAAIVPAVFAWDSDSLGRQILLALLFFSPVLAGASGAAVRGVIQATQERQEVEHGSAVRGFALGVREDLRGTGVGASVILPGFISDAGMFADSKVKLPPGLGTKSPDEVASAVVSAVERDRAAVAVAPVGLRLGAQFASAFPSVASKVTRVTGGNKVARELAEGQLDKRPR